MSTTAAADPRYPIGKYEPQPFSNDVKERWLRDLKFLPSDLEVSIQNLDEAQIDTPYREGGWTVRQLVHHVADSHINAYTRFKLGITEDNPTIRTYEEKAWANTADVFGEPINVSLTLLHALHRRWYAAIVHFTDADWERTIYHPVLDKQINLWFLLGMYAWHGRHHVAHITTLRQQKGW